MDGGISSRPWRRATALASIAGSLAWAAFMLPVVSRAFTSASGAVPLPFPLALVLRKLPVLFPLHMATSACALLLVPLAVATWRVPQVHRWIGRGAAVSIAIGGLASLVVALESVATPAARAGFFCQGAVWLALASSGVWAIRRKRRALHIRLMIATAIVTVSPVLLRLLLHVAVTSPRSFDRTYAMLAWGVWLAPLTLYGMILSIRYLLAKYQLVGARHDDAPTYWNSALIGNWRDP